jgi:CDP-6-deoxy-D-xylo-4-hexulose-3-dehydrase
MNNWSLNVNNFTDEDRSLISSFISDRNNRWTQDKQVKLFEEKFASYVGSKYSVFVSSGSAANTILAQYVKDTSDDLKNKIILPSTTWQTSCSPWIREGFKPIFVDISVSDFCMDLVELEKTLEIFSDSIACVFPTSLIGYSPNISRFQELAEKYSVKIMFDNCENTLGLYNGQNLSSFFTSTTSTYFGHQIQSVEGGFIFTNSQDEYEYFLMLRNHGMTRGLKAYGLDSKKYENNDVDPLFDFYCFGNNYRNTDINAYIGQLDLDRANSYQQKRKELYDVYRSNLDSQKYYLPKINRNLEEDVPFCLPVIPYNVSDKTKALEICSSQSIEYRPIISGFLGYQTCYKRYFENNKEQYVNSIFLHENGFYVGLHPGLLEDQILKFTKELNTI